MIPNIDITPNISTSNSIIGSRAYTFLDSYIYMKNQRYNAMYEKNKEILAIEHNAISLKSADVLYTAFLEQAKMLDSIILRIRNFTLRIRPDVIENLRLLNPSKTAVEDFLQAISTVPNIPKYKYIKYSVKPIKYENMASFMNLYKMEIKYFTSINTQTMNKENPFIRDKATSYLIQTASEHANVNTELLEMENIKILNPAKLKSIYVFFKHMNRYISIVNQDFKTFLFYLRQYSGLKEIINGIKPTEMRNDLISLEGSSGKPITFNDYFVLYKHFTSMIKYMIKIISYHEQQFFNKIYALQGNIESYVSILNEVLDYSEKQELEKSSMNENIETSITKPFLPKIVTLYHGSDKKLSSIKPMSVNVGTRLSNPRKSSFWCLTEDTPLLMAVEQYILDSINIHGILTPLVHKNEIVYPEEYKDIILKSLKNMTVYVYKKDIEKKYVSRGHYIGIDEYTLDIEVTPDSVKKYNLSDVKDSIKFIPLKEIENIVTNFKKNNKMSSDIKSNIIEKLIYYNTDKYWSKLKDANKKLNKPLSESSEILNNTLNETFEDTYDLINGNDQAHQFLNDSIEKNNHVQAVFTSGDFNKYHKEDLSDYVDIDMDDEDKKSILPDSIEDVKDEDISNFQEFEGSPGEVNSICTLRNSLNV